MKKSVSNLWSICCKAVLLRPLSREKRGTVEMLERNGALSLPLQEKTFFEKIFRKVLVVQKLALPLHPLSERKPLKKSSLKDLDINKQVVQELTFSKQQKPSIT